MVKKRILLLIGIAVILSIIMVQTALAANCSYHYESGESRRGDAVDKTGICTGTGEYAVLLPDTHCRSGALLEASEIPYGDSVYAKCDSYVTCGTWGCKGHQQVVHLYYACCNYDITDDSPAEDECSFLIGDPGDEIPPNCPDVVQNETNKNAGWVFPQTYNYKALDCHPEDDHEEQTKPYPEIAGSLGSSTAAGIGVCANGIDDDCDGSVDELNECEADVDRTICLDSSCSIGGNPCVWKEGILGQACCGDDIDYTGSDCGRIISNDICTASGWLGSDASTIGQIYSDGCEGEVVFDSDKSNRCQPTLKPRTFNLKIQKEKAPLPPFYDEFTYKQMTVHEGINNLGDLSDMILLDAPTVRIESDDPEVVVSFIQSEGITKAENVALDSDIEVYALYTPNALNSFEKIAVSKGADKREYVCYETDATDETDSALGKEQRKVTECNGEQGTWTPFSNIEGERGTTGDKRDTSLILYDEFTNKNLAIHDASQPFLYQNQIAYGDGLRQDGADIGLQIPADMTNTNPRLIYSAIGNIDPRHGTIEFWLKPLWNSTTDDKERVFFNFQEADGRYLRIRKLSSGMIEFIIKFGDNEMKVQQNINLIKNEWYKIMMSWNYTDILGSVVDINGNVLVQETAAGSLPDLPKSSTFSLGMKEGSSNLYAANAVFDNLKIYRNFKPTAYYCTDDFEWADDLDNAEHETACKAALDLDWTGSHCCGEPADLPEFYNDMGTDYPYVGGCWASKHVDWGQIPFGELKIDGGIDAGPVINYHGQFEGCQITGTGIASFTDAFTGSQLVENNNICTVLKDARAGMTDFYCSADGNWSLALNNSIKAPEDSTTEDERVLKTFPWHDSNALQQECCAPNDCWNGEKCVYNQREDARNITHNSYRCLDGNWVVQHPRSTWDRKEQGFCPQETQCLVNPEGDAGNNDDPSAFFRTNPADQPQCIQDTQYIQQYYCDNGNWTTRTKLLALQLIDLAAPTGDYELFCSDFEDVLTYVGYSAGADAVQNYITDCTIAGINVPCTNQFCAVKYRDGVAFGTTLNVPVDDTAKSFVKFALGKDRAVCDNVKNNDGDYDLCSNNIYYNHDTESIIKIPSGTLAQAATQQLLANRNFEIRNRFMNINAYIKPLSGLQFSGPGKALVDSTGLFENVFLAKKGSKDLFAYLEERQYIHTPAPVLVDDIGVLFTGLSLADNPCSTAHIGQTDSYAENYACSYSNNNLKFVGVYPSGQRKEPAIKQLWRGLTSLLRIN